MQADIFISVCNFDQSAASSPLTLDPRQQFLQCHTVQHSDVNIIQRGIESCLFFISSGKADSSEAIDSQLPVGWLEVHMKC